MNGNTPVNDIRTLNDEQLSAWLVAHVEKAFRAKQISEWLWKKNVTAFDDMINIPLPLRQALKENFSLQKISIDERQQAATAA
jgi:23S rRNA (adenine2503-C2)-methyltransferase